MVLEQVGQQWWRSFLGWRGWGVVLRVLSDFGAGRVASGDVASSVGVAGEWFCGFWVISEPVCDVASSVGVVGESFLVLKDIWSRLGRQWQRSFLSWCARVVAGEWFCAV